MKLKNSLFKNINNYLEPESDFTNKHGLSISSEPYKSILNIDIKEYSTPISIIIPCWNTNDIVFTLKSIDRHGT